MNFSNFPVRLGENKNVGYSIFKCDVNGAEEDVEPMSVRQILPVLHLHIYPWWRLMTLVFRPNIHFHPTAELWVCAQKMVRSRCWATLDWNFVGGIEQCWGQFWNSLRFSIFRSSIYTKCTAATDSKTFRMTENLWHISPPAGYQTLNIAHKCESMCMCWFYHCCHGQLWHICRTLTVRMRNDVEFLCSTRLSTCKHASSELFEATEHAAWHINLVRAGVFLVSTHNTHTHTQRKCQNCEDINLPFQYYMPWPFTPRY